MNLLNRNPKLPEVAAGMNDPGRRGHLAMLLFGQRVLVAEQLHRELVL